HIPPKAGRYDGITYSKRKYRQRNLIERCFNKLKQFRHIATRYDRTALNYLAMAKIACIRLWLRFYESAALVLRHQRLRRRARRRRRNDERHPGVPAGGAGFRRELPIALQVEIALHLADREDHADLRADAGHARLHVAEESGLPLVGGELLIEVADEPELHLLGDELRGAPVDVEVDAVL